MTSFPATSTPEAPTLPSISFGAGVRLLGEDHYLKELEPLGLSRRGFRALCRALQVPMLHVGKRRFVDVLSFKLAMRAVVRVGHPDFLVPGCEEIRNGRKSFWTGAVTTLDLKYFQRNFRHLLAEILYSSKMEGVTLDRKEIRDLAKEAADRMVRMCLQLRPLDEQDRIKPEPAHATSHS